MFIVIFMRTLTLLFLSVIVLCCSVTTLTIPHPSKVATRPRNIRVFCFDQSFPPDETYEYVQGIKREMPRLNVFPVVEMVGNSYHHCNVTIKNWSNPNQDSRVIGLNFPGKNIIYIEHSRVRLRLPNFRQSIMLHEVGHWLGFAHMCPNGSSQEFIRTNHCSRTIFGQGIMNPVIDSTGNSFTEADFRNIYHHGSL